MSEELLSEIVAAEREIRGQLSALQKESAARLAAVRSETAEELRRESARLEAEFDAAIEQASLQATEAGAALVAEADAYAQRLGSLDPALLERVIVRHLQRICPENDHDRQDEQA